MSAPVLPGANAFVVGHPIKHSRSPLIHGHWLRRYGIEGSYERVDVPPQAIAAFLNSLAERGFRGGNVTIPHKEAAYRLAGELTDRARRLEAVNTVWLDDGRLHGDNTDILGYVAHLDQTLGTGWEAGIDSALVLGAGGAARAVVAGLLDRGVGRIVVANRTLARAEEIVALAPPRVAAAGWADLGKHMAAANLLVNTTSLGMAGQPPLDLNLEPMRAGAVVSDIVYVPLETPLLADARRRHLRTVDGLGMLLHQAVPGFERWFGVRPEVTAELRALVVANIEGGR
ncbi:MAG TPA: shikimate dehydrogenase [Beijerinckiaceae bacterium]|nr:shikimate dehydrogenase [Beijerinckiaceae bacterium]